MKRYCSFTKSEKQTPKFPVHVCEDTEVTIRNCYELQVLILCQVKMVPEFQWLSTCPRTERYRLPLRRFHECSKECSLSSKCKTGCEVQAEGGMDMHFGRLKGLQWLQLLELSKKMAWHVIVREQGDKIKSLQTYICTVKVQCYAYFQSFVFLPGLTLHDWLSKKLYSSRRQRRIGS